MSRFRDIMEIEEWLKNVGLTKTSVVVKFIFIKY